MAGFLSMLKGTVQPSTYKNDNPEDNILEFIRNKVREMGGSTVVSGTGGAKPSVPSPSPLQQETPQMAPQAPTEGFDDSRIREWYASKLGAKDPNRDNLDEYFPVLKELPYLKQKEQEFGRPGLTELLSLMAMYESTGGRNSPRNNLFGAKPRGENAKFPSIRDSIDYQLSENVLGGGAVPEMNILNKQGEITPEELMTLYGAYDPPGVYRDKLIENYKKLRGK